MAYVARGPRPQPSNPLSVFAASALKGTIWYVDAAAGGAGGGASYASAFNTLAKALAACAAGDTILLAPGAYDESVTILRTKPDIALIGVGNRGAVSIAPQTAGAEGLLCHADDVTLVNVGVAAPDAGDYAIKVTGSRFRAQGCKFEGAATAGYAFGFGPGTAAAVAAHTQGKGGDLTLDDCEFCWGFNGLNFITSDYGTPTQVQIYRGRFHNLSNICLLGTPAAFGIGSVRNLEVIDSYFGRLEDGTKPSDFVKVDDASDTGYFSGNRFAIATNASADLKIGAKVLWAANATEAGWSTARPA